MANNFVWASATTLNGTLWDSGTLLSAVPITQIGTLTVKRNSVGDDKVLDAQLNNTGNIVASFDANVDDNTLVAFADGAILNNFSNFELKSGTFGNVRGGIGSFNNSGTLRKTTTGNGGFGVTFNNTGTVNVDSGILTIAGGGVSDGGIFNITSGKTLRFAGFGLSSYTLSNGSKISGNGNLILGYGLFDLKLSEGSAIANTVQLTVDGEGIPSDEFGLHLDTAWTLPTATTWKSGTLKSSGILANSGSLTIDGGGRKYLNAKLNNTGNIVARPIKDPANNRSNLEFLTGSIINNFGDFTYQFGDTGFFNGAVLNNYNNFEFQSGLIEQAEPSVGTFNNFGTFRKTNYIFNNELTGIIETVFNNTGTVTVESGSLSLSGGGVSNKGIFSISSGTDLKFDYGTYTLSSGTKINGNGNLTIGGQGILELKVSEGAAIANTGKFTLDGGEFRVDGDWSLPTVTNWRYGTFRSAGTLTNNGNLNLNLGGLRYLDAQLNNAGNIFQNRDSIRLSDGAILNNSGNYEVQVSGSGSPVGIVQRGNGTFNNSGTYKKTLSGVNDIGVTFNNTGTVEARSGTIDFTSIYTHNNANMILSGGKFIFRRALTIDGGSIEGNGSIDVEDIGMTNTGLLNPRLAGNTEFGRLTINSNYTETNSASINIQLGGNTAGIDFDQVDINGTATFDGKLNVSLLNDFAPTIGSTFDVLTYDALNSSSNLDFTGLAINATLQFLPQWFNNKLTLKVVDKANATVSLSVSPSTVTEDGTPSLIYTFTRTGSTASALTVNYSVGGTATLGTDYTGIAATPATQTVTFAAGSATATVTVNPTADTTIEANESVAFTLSAGTGYSIGTTAAVVGTISNDDPPATTASISAISDNVGLITGTVANGGRSDDRTPTIRGTLSAALASGETLRLYNGSTLLGSATVNNTARTWSYTPAALPLTGGSTYSFTARVADGAGNLAAASSTRSFFLDTTAPIVVSFSPADGAIGVDPAANILLHFSEPIQRGTGTMALRVGSITGAITESFDAATSSRLSISSGRLTLNPTSNLAPNTRYFLAVPAGSFTDRAGNPYAGTTTYDFRTLNAVSGTAANDILSFTSTVDRLTGLAGADTFRHTSLSHSLLPAVASTPIDRITDLVTGLDTIDGPVARSLAQALNPVPLGMVSELSASAITALLTPVSFRSLTTTSTGGVASFIYSDPVAGTRTFLAINNDTAGFSAITDAILEITGYNGSLSSLQVY